MWPPTGCRVTPENVRGVALVSSCALLGACSGVQSALDPAGRGAEALAQIFWWMTGGALVIWLGVVGLALYASRSPERKSQTSAQRLIVLGGVVLPSVVLTALLVYGLALLPSFLAPAPAGSLRIHVTGEQWWWRVRYLPAAGEPVDAANEIRLPVGEPVEFQLSSADVLHSFWIPPLGGKVDMIPGRQTRLSLLPTRTGTFRGVCAEFCGASHAFMSFPVVVQERAEFDRWLAAQAAPARAPENGLGQRGRDVLLGSGCGACHSVRGTRADGVVGPDLTHVGSRLSLAAGTLDNQDASFASWLEAPKLVKPGAHMPSFGMLLEADLRALAAFLEGLE